MRVRAGLAVLLFLAADGLARAEEQEPYVEGSIAWISSAKLDLVGTVAAEIPIATTGRWRVAFFARAVTAISKADTSFTFTVDRVSYAALFTARRDFDRHGRLELFAGEQGVQIVDAEGHARVRIVGAGWTSPDYSRAFGPFGWSGRVSAGIVVEHSGVDAVATASGAVRFLGSVSSNGHIGLGADVTVDALLGPDPGTDTTIGPRVEFDLSGDRRFGLFARWLDAGNPLGIGASGVLVGFDFSQGLQATGPRVVPPEFSGLCAAGVGEDDRALARLDLLVVTPAFFGRTTAEVEVDTSVLTAADLNDLFYAYDVGIAYHLGTWRAGGWFHHRSNHVAGSASNTVTSINVLEAGIESDGWNRAEPSGWVGRAGALDARLRAGWLINSAFGEDVGWHARGGARWASPALGAVRIYTVAELERGDVDGSDYALGLLLPRGWDVRVEVRHDEQLYSQSQRAQLAVVTLRY